MHRPSARAFGPSPLDFEREWQRAGEGASDVRRLARDMVRTVGQAGQVGASDGTTDVVRLDDEALVNIVNCRLPHLVRWTYEAQETHIMLRASLACDVRFRFEGLETMVFDRPQLTLACLPHRVPLVVDIAGNARQQGIVAIFRAATFAARFGLRGDDLPPALRDPAGAGHVASFPVDHRIAALIADTLDSPLQGELRVMQIKGRVAELAAYALAAMAPAADANPVQFNRRRDADVAHAALARLDREYRRPPLLDGLARDFGVSPNRLKAIFKQAFGLTMADYCLQRRVREAQQLLMEAALTVAQVAERVGYEHQSSFTAAFRSHVGLTPREYRRHRAPIRVALPVR